MSEYENFKNQAEIIILDSLVEYGDSLIASTSFGAQSAILLHLISKFEPKIPVIFIDTGYLFKETYLYQENITHLLNLHQNLHIYSPTITSKRMESLYGNLWENAETLDRYNDIVKVEPMNRAIKNFNAKAWISGLRNEQSITRKNLSHKESQNGLTKIYPMIDWTDEIVDEYFNKNNLPKHPLSHIGYKSIGDTHSSKIGNDESCRFNGMKRECGLHERVKSDYQI
jgi:phosphoadenosine phosphosulfate reductase